MKLRTKMFIIYSIIAIIPLTAVFSYAMHQHYDYVNAQISEYASSLSEHATAQLNSELASLNRTISFLVYSSASDEDDSLSSILHDFTHTDKEYSTYSIYSARRRTDSIFMNLMYMDEYIQGLYIVTPSGILFGSSNNEGGNSVDYNYDCRNDLWYIEAIRKDGECWISSSTGSPEFESAPNSIYVARSITDIYTHSLLGVVLVQCDPSIFNLDNLISMPDIALLYVGKGDSEEVLYSNIDSLTAGRDGDQDFQYGMTKTSLATSPLELSVSLNYSRLYDTYSSARFILILIMLTCAAGEIITLYYVTKSITFPIERLSRVMANQNLVTRFVSPYGRRHDEIGMLYTQYAKMLEELQKQVKREYENKLIMADAEMKSLEARINSHFLFNTLESINSMAVLKDEDEIATMSMSLADMFRYAIKTKSELVTVSDELKNVDDYVSIQMLRFSGRFRLVKEIPEPLLNCHVLKLILQPLVENSLCHGLSYCTTGDTITISARTEKQILILTVSDNGQGMTEEKLHELQARLAEKPAFTELGSRNERSIGLKNIDSRIRLYYGTDYGLSIESQEGAGTSIMIRIPVKELLTDSLSSPENLHTDG